MRLSVGSSRADTKLPRSSDPKVIAHRVQILFCSKAKTDSCVNEKYVRHLLRVSRLTICLSELTDIRLRLVRSACGAPSRACK